MRQKATSRFSLWALWRAQAALQNSYTVTKVTNAHNQNPSNAGQERIPPNNRGATTSRETTKGFQAAPPRVLEVEYFHADKGAMPINRSRPANSGAVARS